MNEKQINGENNDKVEQTVPPLVLQEESQGKTVKEKISALLLSIGVEGRPARIIFFGVLTLVFFSASVSFFLLPPSSFQKNKTFHIKNGDSLGQVSLLLKEGNIIRSRALFEFCVTTAAGDKGVKMGRYVFETPIGACAVALRLIHGDFGMPAIKTTIPEGFSNIQIAALLGTKIPDFDKDSFVEHARALEGYLFPETYYFPDDVTPGEVETKLNTTFKEKIAKLQPKIDSSGHSLREIIIMASILEREATTEADRYLVSGVLWGRIKNGMPLQVDAPFLYLLGKKSSELTQSDLQIKSAYNTYRNKGLPGGPIGNPGMSAILAAVSPKESPYVYYLSDSKGVMHYAKTFDEHMANKAKYLR